MDRVKLKAAIEAIIFASERPITVDKILETCSIMNDFEIDRKGIRPILEEIERDFNQDDRGIYLAEVAGGYQLRTKKEFCLLIQKLNEKRPPRFGRALMETLAIVAYRQPVTRADIEDIRGVDSGSSLRGLLEKRLVRILGKKESPGRPIIYGTTKYFLENFGLRDLSQLPALKEFVELEAPDEGAFKLEHVDSRFVVE